jgi:hypothetical protein
MCEINIDRGESFHTANVESVSFREFGFLFSDNLQSSSKPPARRSAFGGVSFRSGVMPRRGAAHLLTRGQSGSKVVFQTASCSSV